MEKEKEECRLEELMEKFPNRSVNELLHVCNCPICQEQQWKLGYSHLNILHKLLYYVYN